MSRSIGEPVGAQLRKPSCLKAWEHGLVSVVHLTSRGVNSNEVGFSHIASWWLQQIWQFYSWLTGVVLWGFLISRNIIRDKASRGKTHQSSLPIRLFMRLSGNIRLKGNTSIILFPCSILKLSFFIAVYILCCDVTSRLRCIPSLFSFEGDATSKQETKADRSAS